MVSDALLMALWRRGKPTALVHHSDQGSQYTSDNFQQLLKSQGIRCSMSRGGECWDNAAMESFFSTLKTERCARTVYRTREEARADVFDYIERFYNPFRKHSKLNYLSLVQFEQQRLKGLSKASGKPGEAQHCTPPFRFTANCGSVFARKNGWRYSPSGAQSGKPGNEPWARIIG